MLTFFDWFAGIGGFRLGLERAGLRHAGACEIDEFCRAVYAARFGAPPLFGDIRDVRPSAIPFADLWVGGFPCQDISIASGFKGDRPRNLEGARSGLWWVWRRLIGLVRPRLVLVENAPGDTDAWLPRLVGSLASIGYDAEWATLPARSFGSPDHRRRVYLLATRRELADPDPSGLAPDLPLGPQYPDPDPSGLAAESIARAGAGPSTLELERGGDSHRLVRRLTLPPSCRVAHGVSRKLDRDRVAALGNSAKPPIAEWIGRRIVAAYG